MTKQELETKIQELELTLNSLELNAKTVKDDLTEANAKLETIDRPIINDLTVDKIYEVISRSFEDFDANDYNPDYEFEIDYDGRINVSSMELNGIEMFADSLHDRLLREFNIVNE